MRHSRPGANAPPNPLAPTYAAAQDDEDRRSPDGRLQPASRPTAEPHRQRAATHRDSPARPHPSLDRRLRRGSSPRGRPPRLGPPGHHQCWNDRSCCPIPSTDHRNASPRQQPRPAGPRDPRQNRDGPRRCRHHRGTTAPCHRCAELASCPTTIVQNHRRNRPTTHLPDRPTNHRTPRLGPAHRGTHHGPARCRYGCRCSSGPTSTIQRDIIPSRSAADTRPVRRSPDAEQRTSRTVS